MAINFKEVEHFYKGTNKNEYVTAIKDINFSIEAKNEFVAIVGKTGSGKSTLIQHINALLIPTSGEVDIFDSVITPKIKKNPPLKNVRKKIGFVFQFPEYQLFEETVLKDIAFAPKNFGFNLEEAQQKSMDAAKELQIEDLLDKSPFNLSGGQMRKVAIAGILSYEPEILVLDEPTRGLDPIGAKDIMNLFYERHKQTNNTMILISHDMDIVYKYATRVIVMNDGQVVYDGDKVNLFKSDVYRENFLEKPMVLQTIDHLNEKLNLNLDYNIFDEEDLFLKLRGVSYE